ncbi:MAG: nucleotidyltransferase family protein [Candidatus Poseidoniaceae archaeon]
MVLAGGVGSRLRPWTDTVPKPLLPMLDRTLLEQVVWGMPEGLVDEIVVAGGYRVEQITEHFATREQGIEVTIVEETEPLGTGGALGNCSDVVSGRFACFNGDVITSLRMEDALDVHTKNGGIGTLALWEVEDPTRFGIVGLDAHQRVTAFKEKPKPEEVFSNLINAGSYLLEEEVFDVMPSGRHSLERDVFPMLAQREQLNGVPFEGYFIDAGTPTSWSDGVEACIAHGRFTSGHVVEWFMVRNGTSTSRSAASWLDVWSRCHGKGRDREPFNVVGRGRRGCGEQPDRRFGGPRCRHWRRVRPAGRGARSARRGRGRRTPHR